MVKKTSLEGLSPDEKITAEAKDRFIQAQEWYGTSWNKFWDDVKFRHGDSDNGWQWPDAIKRARGDLKPSLTLNVVRQHNLQISNAQSQKRAAPNVIPVGGGATMDAANVIKGLFRWIEYRSNSQAIYREANRFQVDGGKGCWRLVTEYCDEPDADIDALDIRVKGFKDPLAVIKDCDAVEENKRDAKWGFVFDIIHKDYFADAYPSIADKVGDSPLLGTGPFASWIKKDHIWVCEYYRKVQKKDTLLSFPGDQGGRVKILQSKLPEESQEVVLKHPLLKMREVWPETVEWFLLAGDKVADRTIWPGKFIPIVEVVGEETIIDGTYDCKGHTRAMKDPQRMLNYNASAQVEFVAGQGKTPWLAALESIAGFEEYYASANTTNHAYLPWNAYDEDFPERQNPKPERIDPPRSSEGYQTGMETAFNHMMMTSGQWQNQMGMMGNERTGAAIDARIGQGDLATFHFEENFNSGLRFTAEMYLDLLPKVYDSKRAVKILADDGSEEELLIDPSSAHAYLQHLDAEGRVIRRILNPNIGTYGIAADVGKSYANKQSETVDKLTLVLTQAPQLVPIIGDLLLKNMDFEDAQEAARRMKRLVPPEALGKGPSQKEQALVQQVAALQVALAKALQDAGKKDIKLIGQSNKTDIEEYRAETDRMSALKDILAMHPETAELVNQLVKEALQTHLGPEDSDPPPVPGAKKGPDDEWYVKDPSTPGGFLKVRVAGRRRGGLSAQQV